MGRFSWLCKECGKGIKSSSFHGDECILFLLKEGKVIQQMEGEYDSYGRTFINGTQCEDVKHSLRESNYWKDPTPEIPLNDYWQKDGIDNPENHGYWLRICDLLDDDQPNNTGMAAVHKSCFKTVPVTRSERDPNQGWGDDEDEQDEE